MNTLTRAEAGARSRSRSKAVPFVLALALAAALPSCARRAAPPSADAPPPRPVNLAGTSVMVLPAQPGSGISEALAGSFDAELAYWLGDRAPRVHWVPAAEVQRLVKSSPGLRIDLRALDVRAFGRMRVQQIGDPLFGDVHNLGAMLDARLALLPASVAYVEPRDSAGHPTSGPGRIEVTAALIQTFGGEVVWYGVVAGEPGAADSPAVVATAARALAKAVVPEN